MGFTGPPNGIQQDSAEDLCSGHGSVVQIFGSAQDAPKDPQSKKRKRTRRRFEPMVFGEQIIKLPAMG